MCLQQPYTLFRYIINTYSMHKVTLISVIITHLQNFFRRRNLVPPFTLSRRVGGLIDVCRYLYLCYCERDFQRAIPWKGILRGAFI